VKENKQIEAKLFAQVAKIIITFFLCVEFDCDTSFHKSSERIASDI
jgi:hypothetical protein